MTALAALPRLALAAALGVALLAAPLAALPATPASAAEFVPGHQTRFSLPDRDAKPTGIATGADGALWIAESNGHALVRMTTDGTTKRFPIPSGANPTAVAAGADGTIWWVAPNDAQYGSVSKAGVLRTYSLDLRYPAIAVAVDADGSAWSIEKGTFPALRKTLSPSSGGSADTTFTIANGSGLPSTISVVGNDLWVGDPTANLILVYGRDGAFKKGISIPSPSVMTVGDGGVYVVSANTDIIKLNLDGSPTGNVWHDPGAPLITDLVVPAPGEQWMTQQRGKNVTVRSQAGGIPPAVALPDAGSPSDLTVGPDGAIWYTTLDTSEVVRIARDYEAPGIGLPSFWMAPKLLAYVGEPLGPVDLNDRGSGTIETTTYDIRFPGLRIDPAHSDTLVGNPTSVEAGFITVDSHNTYYGGLQGRIVYERRLEVRERPAVSRIGGTDRYEAAVNASKSRFPTTATTVYLASGEKFADALSAGPVAIANGAPLLLTAAGALPTSVAAELRRLSPTKIVVVGGPASVSDAVLTQITGAVPGSPSVTRVSGADRYEVSLKLVTGSPSKSGTMYLASGLNYPDALSAAPVASMSSSDVLLVNGSLDLLPDATMALLASRLIEVVRLAGGPASVPVGIERQLEAAGIKVVRLGGADRYETSVMVNRNVLALPDFDSRVASNPVPLSREDSVYLASGENFPDALAGGVAAGLTGSPLYITPKNCVPRPVLLDTGSTGAVGVVVLGGPNTLAGPIESLTVCP